MFCFHDIFLLTELTVQQFAIGFLSPKESTEHLGLVAPIDTQRIVINGLPEMIPRVEVGMIDICARVGKQHLTIFHQLETQCVGMAMGGNTAKSQRCMVNAYQRPCVIASQE